MMTYEGEKKFQDVIFFPDFEQIEPFNGFIFKSEKKAIAMNVFNWKKNIKTFWVLQF